MRKGFTMIELIFVIVILGILAAVAIPRLAATRDDAEISKGASNLATLMSDLSGYYTSQGSFGDAVKIKDITSVALVTDAAGSTAIVDQTVNDLKTAGFFLKVKDKGCVKVTIDGSTIKAAKVGDGICTDFHGISSVQEIIGTGTDGKEHKLGGSKVKF